MAAPRASLYTPADIAKLREVWPTGGLKAAVEAFPDRSWHSLQVKASRLGLKMLEPQWGGRGCALTGDLLEQAIQLREAEGWSFGKIGAHLGFCESSVNNAVMIELCRRKGYTPAERLPSGRLTSESIERLRWMLKKGLKGVEIQLRLGVSASAIAEQRRRYNADLKARGKALLPPPGGGIAYSGAKISRAKRQDAERLFLEGYGTAKVSAMSGVSKTACTRIRNKLIARLRRKGECLPGCDIEGKRHVMRDHARSIPAESLERLKALILERVPVRRAALMTGVGSCAAYRVRDALKAEMGDAFPKPRLPGRARPLQREMMASQAIPADRLWRFRQLVREHGDVEARRLLRAEIAAELKAMPFEERVKHLSDPSQIVANFKPSKAIGHDVSLTGNSTSLGVEAA